MKKNKGFTLIELLVTIVIVISIFSIAIVSIIKVSKAKKQESLKKIQEQVETAAQSYFNNNEYEFEGLTEGTEEYYIPVDYLVKYDYLNTLTDPTTGKKINGCDAVSVKKVNGKYVFKYVKANSNSCTPGSSFAVKYISEDIKVNLVYSHDISSQDGWYNKDDVANNKNYVTLIVDSSKSVSENVKYCIVSKDTDTLSLSHNISEYCSDIKNQDNRKIVLENNNMEKKKIIACATYGGKDYCNNIIVGLDIEPPTFAFYDKDSDESNYQSNNLGNLFAKNTNLEYKSFCKDNLSGCEDLSNDTKKISIVKNDKEIMFDKAGNEGKLNYTCYIPGSDKVDLLLLVDGSNSMLKKDNGSDRRIDVMKSALKTTLSNIKESYSNINIAIYNFHGITLYFFNSILDYTPLNNNNIGKINKSIDNLYACKIGGTPLGRALHDSGTIIENRINYLEKVKDDHKQVIMIVTDGLAGFTFNDSTDSNTPISSTNSNNMNNAITNANKLKNKGVLVYTMMTEEKINSLASYNSLDNGLEKLIKSSDNSIRLREIATLSNTMSSNWLLKENKEIKKNWSTKDNSTNDNRWQLIYKDFKRNSLITGDGFVYSTGLNKEAMIENFETALKNSIEYNSSCD